MTVSSANPDRLDSFVADAPTGRLAAADVAQRGAALAADVMSRCSSRGLSGHNFGAITTLLHNMAADDQFVRGVADALRAADRHDGIATMTDVAIGARLVSGTYDAEGTPVTISAVALLGEPANSGLIDDPICAANGNFIHRDLDLVFPGTSAALNIHRFYNSLATARVGAFGAGWTSVFDVALDIDRSGAEPPDGATVVTARLADGAALEFRSDGEGWSTRDRRRFALVRAGRGWELHEGDTGERRWRFDRHGRLTGWLVGRVGVGITRGDDGRIATLTHDRSAREVRLSWTGDRVAALATDDGRTVAYTYGERQTLARAESRSGWFDYVYDGRLMLRATDPDGVSEFLNEYDAEGRVARQTSPFGRTTTYRYEMPGTTVITDHHDARQAMVHDARGNLAAIIDADGAVLRLTYDDHDRLTTVVSQTGDTWRHEFHQVTGDLVRRTDPDELAQTWEWDHRRRLVATVDRTGGVTRLEYDRDHRVPCRVVAPDGSTATAELDEWGQPLVITDPDGVVTRLVWDRDGQLAGVIDALGNTSTVEFDAAGLLLRLLDPSGATTELTYDHGARLVRGTTGDRVHEFRYTPGGRVAGGADPAEGAWSAVFGQHGAVTSITGAAGHTLGYRYDRTGNLVELIGPEGAAFRQEFDDVGRLVAAFAPDGSASRLEHDPAGRVVAVTDPAGRTHRRTLDAMGRTATITAPGGGTTRWTYHPAGEVATVTLADGRVWATEIDAMGRVVAVIDPTGRRASRTYTPGGRLASRTDPTGATEHYAYDAAGRCVAVVTDDGRRVEYRLDAMGRPLEQIVSAPGQGTWHHAYEWDTHGGLAARTDPHGTTRWQRDGAGRVVAEIDGTGARRRYHYDARGLLTTATDPAGHTTSYRHDLAGRLIEQMAPGDRPTTWSHDAAGLVRGCTDPAGVTTEVTRDATGAITSLRRGATGWDRELDAAGRELARHAPDGTPLARYGYDALGRMVSAEAPLAGLVTEFLWDGADHLVPAAGPPTPDRDRPGRALAANGHAAPLPRDAAGRLLAGPSGTMYRYDTAGRLVEIAPADAEAITFDYGPDGLLTTERVGAHVRHFMYDAAGRVVSITIDGLGTSVFTYDAAGRRHSQTGPDGSAVVFGWNDVDQLVSITRTSPDATVHHLAIDVDALGRPRRINGIEIDPGATAPVAVAGVVVLGARVYDPLTHQFLSADALTVQPGSNGGAERVHLRVARPGQPRRPHRPPPDLPRGVRADAHPRGAGPPRPGLAGGPGRPVGHPRDGRCGRRGVRHRWADRHRHRGRCRDDGRARARDRRVRPAAPSLSAASPVGSPQRSAPAAPASAWRCWATARSVPARARCSSSTATIPSTGDRWSQRVVAAPSRAASRSSATPPTPRSCAAS